MIYLHRSFSIPESGNIDFSRFFKNILSAFILSFLFTGFLSSLSFFTFSLIHFFLIAAKLETALNDWSTPFMYLSTAPSPSRLRWSKKYFDPLKKKTSSSPMFLLVVFLHFKISFCTALESGARYWFDVLDFG